MGNKPAITVKKINNMRKQKKRKQTMEANPHSDFFCVEIPHQDSIYIV
jgi:hypothetical protein